MIRLRIELISLSIFNHEHYTDTHVALYLDLVAVDPIDKNRQALLGRFRWNNGGQKASDRTTRGNPGRLYTNFDIDPSSPRVFDFDISVPVTMVASAFTASGGDWPSEGDNDNFLGKATVVIDPGKTLATHEVGPTTTDQGNLGFLLDFKVSVLPPRQPRTITIAFNDLFLIEDEEFGDTHVAVRAFVDGVQLIRWNNGGHKSDERAAPYTINIVTAPFVINGASHVWIEGWADDDNPWPSSNSAHENFLGAASIYLDSTDVRTLQQTQMGPTQTDQGHQGFKVSVTITEVSAANAPKLTVLGMEVTQAIQHFGSEELGPDNSVPLVANRATLVRVYVDSGYDGIVTDVAGELLATGTKTLHLTPYFGILTAARPRTSIDRRDYFHTLNFLIEARDAVGTLSLKAQVKSHAMVAESDEIEVIFTPIKPLNILVYMIQSSPMTLDAPDPQGVLASFRRMPLVFPLPPSDSFVVRNIPSSIWINTRNLSSAEGMSDLMTDLENNRQENYPEDYKLWGTIAGSVNLDHPGKSRKRDNVAIGYNSVLNICHEFGHLFGLDHVNCGNVGPPIDFRYLPTNGTIGDIGVAVLDLPAAALSFTTTGDPTLLQQIMIGALAPDLMSYCFDSDQSPSTYGGQWIGGYSWTKLLSIFAKR